MRNSIFIIMVFFILGQLWGQTFSKEATVLQPRMDDPLPIYFDFTLQLPDDLADPEEYSFWDRNLESMEKSPLLPLETDFGEKSINEVNITAAYGNEAFKGKLHWIHSSFFYPWLEFTPGSYDFALGMESYDFEGYIDYSDSSFSGQFSGLIWVSQVGLDLFYQKLEDSTASTVALSLPSWSLGGQYLKGAEYEFAPHLEYRWSKDSFQVSLGGRREHPFIKKEFDALYYFYGGLRGAFDHLEGSMSAGSVLNGDFSYNQRFFTQLELALGRWMYPAVYVQFSEENLGIDHFAGRLEFIFSQKSAGFHMDLKSSVPDNIQAYDFLVNVFYKQWALQVQTLQWEDYNVELTYRRSF